MISDQCWKFKYVTCNVKQDAAKQGKSNIQYQISSPGKFHRQITVSSSLKNVLIFANIRLNSVSYNSGLSFLAPIIVNREYHLAKFINGRPHVTVLPKNNFLFFSVNCV